MRNKRKKELHLGKSILSRGRGRCEGPKVGHTSGMLTRE